MSVTQYIRNIKGHTSVKHIGVLINPTATSSGIADFRYQPVFSVFDFGTIVPPIPLDNSTVCLMAGYNFERLEEAGIKTHYIGLVTDEGECITATQSIQRGIAPTTIRVEFGHRIKPTFDEETGWDYSMFENPGVEHYVQPMEFMSRNSLPDNSSVWKRVERGSLSLQDLGLSEGFQKGDKIPDDLVPILDYSTKFEPEDRYVSPSEAQLLMHMDDATFAKISAITRQASNLMTDLAASRGFERKDGKVEYVGSKLADAVCTWHEDRLVLPNGLGISKQRIRNKVVQLNPKWYANINESKRRAREEGHADFRDLMDKTIEYDSPNAEFFHAINNLFRAGTNKWVDAEVYNFPNADSIDDGLERAVEEFERQVA